MSAGRSHMIHYYEVRNAAEGFCRYSIAEGGVVLSGVEAAWRSHWGA
jgi:hypothetical protein